MPNEFDFKKYTTIEEFIKTLEGTKYLHDLYLKAVNHPIRREILVIVNNVKKVSKKELLKILLEKKIVDDEPSFLYHIDYLIKALCLIVVNESDEIFYEITQSGKVIEFIRDSKRIS